MIEETVTVTVTRAVIADIAAARDLQDWCLDRGNLYCTISARVDGAWLIEIGGTTVDTHQIEIGDTVSWDGAQFSVSRP